MSSSSPKSRFRIGRPRLAHVVGASITAYGIAVVGAAAWAAASRWDLRVLEASLFDLSALIELPWRAGHGEWVGRDFAYPVGPLYQALTWIASGFSSLPTAWSVALFEVATFVVAASIAASLVLSLLREARSRLLAWALLMAVVLYSPSSALRFAFSLLFIHVLALGEARDRGAESFRERPLWRWALVAALVAEAQVLLSFERGAMAAATLVAMVSYVALSRWRGALPLAPVLRRLLAFLAALAGLQVLCAALAAVLGASYFGYLAESGRLSRQFAAVMSLPFPAQRVESVIAIGAIGLVGAMAFATRRLRDLHAGSLLIGSLPLVATACFRSDTAHIWQGVAPVAVILWIVGMTGLERGRLGRTLATGVPALVLVLSWIGSSEGLVKERLLFQDARRVARGELTAAADYVGDLSRITDWTRDRRREDPALCMGFYAGADVVHALADVPGPTATRLWSSQREGARLAGEIRRESCRYFVQNLPSSLETSIGRELGEDFLVVAELYEPIEPLGPAVVAMGLRPEAMPAKVRTIDAAVVGSTQVVSVPGRLEIAFDEPLADTELLRITYRVEAPAWAHLANALPRATVVFSESGRVPLDAAPLDLAFDGPEAQLLAVNAAAAEWRWHGARVGASRSVDRMVLNLEPRRGFGPAEVAFHIESIEALGPGGTALDTATEPAPRPLDLVREARDGRALPVSLTAWRPRDGHHVAIRPTPETPVAGGLYWPLRPRLGTVLRGEFGIEELPSGNGADVVVELLAPVHPPTRTVLASFRVERGAEPTELEIPLDPWVGLDVLLRIAVTFRPDGASDALTVLTLGLDGADEPATVAGAIRAGVAVHEGGELRLEGANVSLRAAAGTPARVIVPLRAEADTCFNSGVLVPGTGTEATAFGVAVRGARAGDDFEPVALLHMEIEPGQDAVPLPAVSLADWAGRDVKLLLTVASGRRGNGRWVSWSNPRIVTASCGLTRSLVTMFDAGEVSVRQGRLERRGMALMGRLTADEQELDAVFPVQPERSSCWDLSVTVAGGEAEVRLAVEEGGERSVLARTRLDPGVTMPSAAIPLARFGGRPVDLVVEAVPTNGGDTVDVRIDRPVIRRCR